MSAAKKKPATTKAPRKAKPSAALLKKLEDRLGFPDVAAQCLALHDDLERLTPGRRAAAAAAVLEQTKKGAPVARAYLTVLASEGDGPLDAADVVVRHCAKMERGRRALRPAFVATWRRASDVAAIDEAYKNFSKGIVEDPDLLAAGFEAARKRSAHLAAAERITMLERARKLAPLVAELQGSPAEKARAKKAVEQLSPDDKFHVYARAIDTPSTFDEDVAVAAMLALTADTRASDMALSAAIADMRYHGIEKLVAAWKKRVLGGDEALVLRLLALFEWTGLWATEADQLEPYIRGLAPVANRPDVFAQVEVALASDSAVMRQAVLEQWLMQPERARVFTDSQIDKLVRSTIAIAETSEDDQSAACEVIARLTHSGAAKALIDGMRGASAKKSKQMRAAIYIGLARLSHPQIPQFLVERMFVEREEYRALRQAIETRLDGDTHKRIVAMLADRAKDANAAHAATLYATCLAEGPSASPRLLVELARTLVNWQPKTNDDGRRLRYVFEHATLAAIAIGNVDDAKKLLARAKELPDKPYTDYHVVALDTKTPSAFNDAAGKKQLAALESGKLEEDIAAVKAAAEAARAAGKPIAVDNERLGVLAGCTVKERFLDDKQKSVVWFFDETGALRVYDGFGVVPPPFAVTGLRGTGIAADGVAQFIGGKTMLDERVTLLDAQCRAVREVIRIADRVLVFDGSGLDSWDAIAVEVIGLKFNGYVAARDAVARLAANPPKGMKRTDPWYVDGVGAIQRMYFVPLKTKPAQGDARLVVLGEQITGPSDEGVPPLERKHATPAAAIKAYQEWEGRVFAAGGRITKICVDRDTTRREDTLLSAYLEERHRNDNQDATWHLRGLEEMHDALVAAGLAEVVPDVMVWHGPAATDAEIAAYQAAVPVPLPAELVKAWRDVGGAGFECERTTIKFLTPTEILASREKSRADLDAWLGKKLKGKKLATARQLVPDLDVIVTRDGEPLLVFDTRQRREDGRCFATPGGDWWEKSLGWELATVMLEELKDELERRVGDIFRLRLGQRASADAKRVRLAKGDKTFEAIVDGAQLLTRTLTPNSAGTPTIKALADAEAARTAFDKAVDAAKKKGFA